jgi:hypothetical protein
LKPRVWAVGLFGGGGERIGGVGVCAVCTAGALLRKR